MDNLWIHVKRRQPRTALIVAAIRRKAGWKQCKTCKDPKPPEGFYEGRDVCRQCVSRETAKRQAKGHQSIVRIGVPGWGCRT